MSGEHTVTDIFGKGREFRSRAEAIQTIERDVKGWLAILSKIQEPPTRSIGMGLIQVSVTAGAIQQNCSTFRKVHALDSSSPDVWYELPDTLHNEADELFLSITDLTPQGLVWLRQGEGVMLRIAIEQAGPIAGETCLEAMLADPDARRMAGDDAEAAGVGTSLGSTWLAIRDYWQPAVESKFKSDSLAAESTRRGLYHAVEKAEKARGEIEKSAIKWRSNLQSQVEEADQRHSKRSETLDARLEEGERRLESLLEKHGHKAAIEGPSRRWKRRANELKAQEGTLLTGIYVVTIAGMAYLGFLLNQWITESPWMPMSVGSFKGIAIFLAILAGWGFLLRTLARLTFSTIHLRRDAEERLALSQYYVSLLETDKEIGDQARQVILSALFTRSQSGLLQTESDPSVGFDTLLSRFRS